MTPLSAANRSRPKGCDDDRASATFPLLDDILEYRLRRGASHLPDPRRNQARQGFFSTLLGKNPPGSRTQREMRRVPEHTDAEIVDGCRSGARWARKALFEKHHRGIFRFLVAQCGDPALAEDLVQETFLAAFESIDRFRGDARVETWMTRIALNCLYANARRTETGRRKMAEVEAGDPRADWTRNRTAGTSSEFETRDLMRRALDRLDRDDASIILLHDLQGLRYREIAEIQDVAIGTVGSRLSRARDRLREIVEELRNGPEETAADKHPTSEMRDRNADPPTRTKEAGLRRILWSEK